MTTTIATDQLDNVKTVIDAIGTIVTAIAVVVGGSWAYFKFVKGRTYRPRLEVELASQWITMDDDARLWARVRVTNIGASVVTLIQHGTGLQVSVPAADQPEAPAATTWDYVRVFEVFKEHQWIEPGETISDDLVLNLGAYRNITTLFEMRLVWHWSSRRTIVVFARQVMPADSTIDGKRGA